MQTLLPNEIELVLKKLQTQRCYRPAERGTGCPKIHHAESSQQVCFENKPLTSRACPLLSVLTTIEETVAMLLQSAAPTASA